MIALARVDLSIVVPALDEARRLPVLVAALREVVDTAHTEVIFVDDGSSDDTATVAERLLAEHDLRGAVVRLPENQGKGAALRAGVARSRGSRIVMMDADLATDLEALEPLLAGLADHEVVVGSRVAPGARVLRDARHRRALGAATRLARRLLTPLSVSDTQCGFKAFRGPVGRLLFALSREDRFGNDVELLLLADRLGLSIGEVPVSWTSVPGSKVRVVADSVGTLREILRARRRPLASLGVAAVHVAATPELVAANVRAVDLVLPAPDGVYVVLPGADQPAVDGVSRRVAALPGVDGVSTVDLSGDELAVLLRSRSSHR